MNVTMSSPKNNSLKNIALAILMLSGSLASARAAEPLPEAIAAPGQTAVVTLHAEGAQVYECKAGADGKPIWSFREPIATLMADGKTIGRHYAGPNWDHSDGSGVLADVTTVQRINTKGGKRDGTCETVGSFLNVPYSADYVFLRKS